MSNIVQRDLANVAYDNMAEYSASVILDRAIPDARDGLKPVQRRILWQTHLSKITPSSKHVKVIKLGGAVAAFHPHGDASTQGAIVNLAQPWIKPVKLIDIHGNYGSIDGSPAAAGRYISARQANAAQAMLNKIDHNAVDLMDNFDNTALEPKVLPASFPVAMTNGASGIAVAVSTKILPHNPLELLKASKALAQGKIKEPHQLSKYIKGPDFPTGGLLVASEQGNLDELATGQGRFKLRGKIEYHENDSEPHLEITEIPYNVTTTKLIERMSDVLENARALGVIEIRDETIEDTRTNIKLMFKKGSTKEDMQKVASYLYKKTDLEVSLSSNNIMISKGRQKTLNMMQYLKQFIEFRAETLVRIWKYDLEKLESRLEILEGLLRAYDITEEIVQEAKSSESKKHLSEKLVQNFDFTERQAETIAGMPIYQLGKQDYQRLSSERESNLEKSEELRSWLKDDESVNEQLIKDLDNSISQFKDYKRQTQLVDEDELPNVEEVKIEDVVEEKDVKVVIKRDLQIFQIGRRAYDNQIENYKDTDIVSAFDAKTTDYVCGITKQGKVVTRFVDDLDHLNLDGSSEGLYKQISDLKSNDEFIGGVINNPNEKDESNRILIASHQGYVKIIEAHKLLPSVKTKSYIKKLGQASNLKSKGDYLVFAHNLEEDDFNKILHVELKDNSKRSGKANRKIELSKWKDKSYGPGGSGFRGINTKDGQLDFISYEIIGNEQGENEEQDVNDEQ